TGTSYRALTMPRTPGICRMWASGMGSVSPNQRKVMSIGSRKTDGWRVQVVVGWTFALAGQACQSQLGATIVLTTNKYRVFGVGKVTAEYDPDVTLGLANARRPAERPGAIASSHRTADPPKGCFCS